MNTKVTPSLFLVKEYYWGNRQELEFMINGRLQKIANGDEEWILYIGEKEFVFPSFADLVEFIFEAEYILRTGRGK